MGWFVAKNFIRMAILLVLVSMAAFFPVSYTHLVNTEFLSTYWNVGRIIVEYEQKSKERADYGKQTLKQLSKDLTK